MGGKQSIADAEHGRLTEAEIRLSKGIFQQLCLSAPGKGCSYEEFVRYCKKIHLLLTQFLIEFYFGNDTSNMIESYKEFVSIYAYLVRGSVKDRTRMMEVLLLGLQNHRKSSKDITPASMFQHKLATLDINYDIDEHTFKMRQENYLRGLICTQIKIEYATETEEFISWRRINSRFSIGDIDKLTRALQRNMSVPSSTEDMTKWVKKWKTLAMLHYAVYGHFFGLEDIQVTKSLYPLCESKHRQNGCLMDMCSIIHLNCYLPSQFRHRWRLLFSSAVHGANFRHVIDRMLYEGPNIVVIRDKNNHVFGGYASESWRPCTGFYGNYTSFLFQVDPNLAVYEASGKDDNYQLMNLKGPHRGFGMGKGPMNLCGWWIEPERMRGSCALSCSTYQGLPVLAGSQHFEIHTFEIWGVADIPKKHKKRSAIRFHTFAERAVGDSNIHKAGKTLLKRTGVQRYTDGYGITHAAMKWQQQEDDEAPHVEKIPDEEKGEEEESEDFDEEESDSEDFYSESETEKNEE